MGAFNFSLFNYRIGGWESYQDIVRILRAQLEELGHDVSESDEFAPPPAVNLIFEGFNLPSVVATLCQVADAGYAPVCIATEKPTQMTPHGFLWNHHVNNYWGERAYGFCAASRCFIACWCLVAGSAHRLKSWVSRCADIELGFSNKLLCKDEEPVADFCAFGSSSPRRVAVVAELRRAGHSVRIVPHTASLAERDATIRSVKVVVDIKPHDWWSLVSSTRIVAALHQRRPVVVEARDSMEQSPWFRVARFQRPGEGFVDAARGVLANWCQARDYQRLAAMGMRTGLRPATAAAIEIAADMPPCRPLRMSGSIAIPDVSDPILICTERSINVVAFNGDVYAVPQRLGAIRLECSVPAGARKFPDVPTAVNAINAGRVA